jgi:hypothetical protein
MEKAVILLTAFLCACSSVPEPQVITVKNDKKEAYIDHIETEASEASAALSAVTGYVSKPADKVVDITIQRLDAIKKPTEGQIKKWAETVKDPKKIEAEKEKSKQLEEELNEAWTAAEIADARAEALSREAAYKDIRNACIWLGSVLVFIGTAIAVAEMWILKRIKEGAFVLAIGMIIISAPLVIQDVVESVWFKTSIAMAFITCLGFGVYRLFHSHKEITSTLNSSKSYNAEPIDIPCQDIPQETSSIVKSQTL